MAMISKLRRLFRRDPASLIERVQIIRLEPGDTVVLHVDAVVSQADAERIKRGLERTFAGHQSVVLGKGTKLEVMRPGRPDPTPPGQLT